MSIHVIGGGGEHVTFDRTFFDVTLGDIIERFCKNKKHRLILYLVDGVPLEVCSIEGIEENYLMLRTFLENENSCDLSINLVPYTLIYRIEVSPHEESSPRVGFTWTPPAKKKS